MCDANLTQVTHIQLLGFQGLYSFKVIFFIVFLLSYIVILNGNFLIITLVTTVDHLRLPMFLFLKHLAIVDVLFTTNILPMLLHVVLTGDGTLSLFGCLTQYYICQILGAMQCFLIPIMSFDRFLAICIPLRYASLMNPQACHLMVIGSWFLALLLISSEMIVLFQLHFCGHHNYIDFFFCDFGPIIELDTSDKSSLMVHDFVISMLTLPFSFGSIVISYICITFAILKISSAKGRRKAFSTCSSHLATVCSFYGTLITVYIVPTNYNTVNINKYRSLLYIVVTPLMNPIIYSLRNREIKRAFPKFLSNIGTLS